ncbi:MAG: zinc-binding alcohol dehydrogenase family protein [Undibacterium curvum]|uniref:zinc-binding alcohol dehydrogenase family protein n=1 Tax=Undibacterium curvum TaxID=2762294 RepID=UPI003BC34F62
MKAIAYQHALPIAEPNSLVDITLPAPVATGHDLLVEVRAISVNPVDAKVRANVSPEPGEWKVLGWDVAGVVQAVGPDVTLFKPGDRVWYAGDISRPGANAELHLVDERIVGHMPKSLSFAQAAALPLTTITAWELLFDRLQIVPGKRPTHETLLITGAAGGVGSILTQLASRLTAVKVIGTASRAETKEWVASLGAHHVLDHSQSLADQIRQAGLRPVTHIASLTQTDQHYADLAELIAPQGKLSLIDDPAVPIDVMKLKRKSVSLHWEFMFTRSLFQTSDMLAQHRLLTEVAALIDAGVIRSTLGQHFGNINAGNLKRAHALLESGKARGKIVLEGF